MRGPKDQVEVVVDEVQEVQAEGVQGRRVSTSDKRVMAIGSRAGPCRFPGPGVIWLPTIDFDEWVLTRS
jgi:hypothetical protein